MSLLNMLSTMKERRSRWVCSFDHLMSTNKTHQITRKTKRTLQKSVVEHAVAERKKWAKFGKEKGNKEGPDHATTTVGENVALKLSAGNKVIPQFQQNNTWN